MHATKFILSVSVKYVWFLIDLIIRVMHEKYKVLLRKTGLQILIWHLVTVSGREVGSLGPIRSALGSSCPRLKTM